MLINKWKLNRTGIDKSIAAPTTDGPDGAYVALCVLEVDERKKNIEPNRVTFGWFSRNRSTRDDE